MRDELLGCQIVQLLALADLAHLVGSGAEDGVVVVERVCAISHVRADQGVEDVDVVHGMDGALEVEVVEVEELGDEDVRVEPLEEPGAPQTPADAERADPRRPLVQAGIVRVRRHVADRLAQLDGQMPDEVSPVVPVLAALGIEDDPAVAAWEPPEGPIL